MIGLYIHVPFCLSKCPYCDFYSERYSKFLAEEYKKAVIRNLAFYNESYDTVYFGGGTPILLADEIADILGQVKLAENAEVTVEANPCVSDERRLSTLIGAGVNRISFGVQSMNEGELNFLGRKHSAEQAAAAIELAHSIGFHNISADLMLGLEHQAENKIKRSVEALSALPVTHISAYLLKIEEGTPFSEMNIEIPEDERLSELYLYACDKLEGNGFFQYEISNFSKTGAECRHNLKYWRCEEYLGIGPAAHSFFNGKRFLVPRSVNSFISSEYQPTEITDENPRDFDEYAMLKLRLTEGLSFSDCEKFGVEREVILNRLRKIPNEYFIMDGNYVRLTKKGFLLSNAVIGKILGY